MNDKLINSKIWDSLSLEDCICTFCHWDLVRSLDKYAFLHRWFILELLEQLKSNRRTTWTILGEISYIKNKPCCYLYQASDLKALRPIKYYQSLLLETARWCIHKTKCYNKIRRNKLSTKPSPAQPVDGEHMVEIGGNHIQNIHKSQGPISRQPVIQYSHSVKSSIAVPQKQSSLGKYRTKKDNKSSCNLTRILSVFPMGTTSTMNTDWKIIKTLKISLAFSSYGLPIWKWVWQIWSFFRSDYKERSPRTFNRKWALHKE